MSVTVGSYQSSLSIKKRRVETSYFSFYIHTMNNEIEFKIDKWAKENLGDDFEFRENQLEVITKIVKNCLDENGHQSHLVQAPTGSGKSIILIVSACVLAEEYDKESFLLCSDLSLWKQYDDFIDAHKTLKNKIGRIRGQQSYVCQENNKDISKAKCRLAKVSWATLFNSSKASDKGYECATYCPYVKARKQAMMSKVTIMTYQMYFRGVAGRFDKASKYLWHVRDVVFCDECHNIPSLLQSAYCPQLKSTDIDKYLLMYRYGVSLSGENLFKDEWADEMTSLATDISPSSKELNTLLSDTFNSIYDYEGNEGTVVCDNLRKWNQLISKFDSLADKIQEKFSSVVNGRKYISPQEYEVYEATEWYKKNAMMIQTFLAVVVGEENVDYVVCTPSEHTIEKFSTKKGKMTKVHEKMIDLQCAKEDYIAKNFLLLGPEHVVMTSATIGDMDSFATNLGIDGYEHDNLSSLFNFSNSPIYVLTRWKMSQKFKDESFPYIQKATYKLCNRYSQKKGLIQTWTYDLAKKIYNEAPQALKDRMLLYNDAKEKRELIEYHKTTDIPTILVGPTLNEGIDLPGDECRFIIMIKMPFPYLGSKLVKRKADLYDGWYQNETLRTVIQSIGRGVRYDGDWCQTYILDGSFGFFYQQTKDGIPLETKRRIKFYS